MNELDITFPGDYGSRESLQGGIDYLAWSQGHYRNSPLGEDSPYVFRTMTEHIYKTDRPQLDYEVLRELDVELMSRCSKKYIHTWCAKPKGSKAYKNHYPVDVLEAFLVEKGYPLPIK